MICGKFVCDVDNNVHGDSKTKRDYCYHIDANFIAMNII